jgi:hypothetical protein
MERPEFWASSVVGLTPTGSYTVSQEEALRKFPGLAYDKNFISLTEPTVASPSVEQSADIKIAEFQNKLLDQAKGEAVDWSESETETSFPESKEMFMQSQEIAQVKPVEELKGQFTRIKYDPVMKQYVPYVDPGKVLLNSVLKTASTGPRGEDIAQALPVGPRGMDRNPGTYHPGNIIPLQTPGSNWRPGEGYMIQNPFGRSPQTGPGLSQTEEKAIEVASATADDQKGIETYQSEFDPQKAKAAATAAKEYRRAGQVEDPFRSAAFG